MRSNPSLTNKLSFKRAFRGRPWFLALAVAAVAIYAFLYDWGAALALLLQSAPFAVVMLAAPDLFLDEQVPHKSVEPISHEPAQTNPWPESYQDYINRVEALAVARERARIAREFHDTLGHTLTALDVQMELVARLPAEQIEDIQQAARQARALVKEGLADIRRAIQALQPAALENFSVAEAIHSLVMAFERSTQITTRWQVKGKATPLPTELALPLYRITQEALTNVRRHVNASCVTVTLAFAPDSVTLVVEDNGVAEDTGARHPATNGGFGLHGIRSRVEELHGTFYAGPEPAGGFRVETKLPC